MAKRKNSGGDATPGRIAQMRMVAGMIHKANPKALPIIIGTGLGIIVVFVIAGLLTGFASRVIPFGVLLGILAAVFLFGRYAQSVQYAAIEGQPGAAAAVLQSIRGSWTVTPAVAANRNMDVVHRAVGKPGVVLVGEGSPARLPTLLAAEKKRVARVAYEVPIYDFQVGDSEGQVPIRKLERKVRKLPKKLNGPTVADLNYRLKALPASLQAPKGPVPRNIRQAKMPRPRMR